MSSPPPGTSIPSPPDWPHQASPALVQRLVDQHMILTLERGEAGLYKTLQSHLLVALLNHARTHSSWWRDRIQVTSAPGIQDLLQQLPVLKRAELRDAFEQGGALPVPAAHGKVATHSTSGTSGIPVRFGVTDLVARMNSSHYLADHARHARDISKPRAVLSMRPAEHPGQSHVTTTGDPWLGEGLSYQRRSGQFTSRENAQWLAAMAPAYLTLRPSVLDALLDEYESADAPPPAQGIEQLLTLGEMVSDQLRERSQRILGASIRDRYSCEEAGAIAFQCPQDHTRYHIAVTSAVVEVVDAMGQPCAQGVPGQVLVTSLHNWASPVIRYDLGDWAAWHPQCTCGAQVPTLSQLLGRKLFLFLLPSGERRDVYFRARDWLAIAPVVQHRLTQVSITQVRVELVLRQPLTAEQREAILSMLRKNISPDMHFEINEVAEIPQSENGKNTSVISLI